jgi:ribosomal protein S18 acetylase RimI-like enzyme
MIQVKKIEVIDQLSTLKQQYLKQTTAPLDGMWLCGFIPMATHFGFYDNEQLVGYCCINNEGYLLQFYLCPEKQAQASLLFGSLFVQNSSTTGEINGAYVSSAEPQYLSLCLDTFSKFKVNSLMYQLSNNSKPEQEKETGLQMEIVKSDQLAEAVEFAKNAIGAPEEWLTGYFTNLINRQELFAYWENGQLLATGECRDFVEYQTDYTDLGLIVDTSTRGQGLGTKVIKYLITIAEAKGLKPICSTEKTNIGAQKAISRAGFYTGNRIIQFYV